MSIDNLIQQTVKDAVMPEIESLHRKLDDFIKPLTLEGTAKMLDVSERTIQAWTKRANADNPLPVHYAGDLPRFFRNEIYLWMDIETKRRKI